MLAPQRTPAFTLVAILLLASAAPPAPASAQDHSGLDIGDDGNPDLDGLRSFLELTEALDEGLDRTGLPPLERPVLLGIAREARVEPAEVLRLRLRGRRWHSLLEHYGLSPNIFRVPLEAEALSGSYRRLYRYSPSEWDEIYLSDQDYVDLALLERAYVRYRDPLAEVLRLQAEGRGPSQPDPPLSERQRRSRLERQRQERLLKDHLEDDRRAAQRLAEQREDDRRAAQRLAEQRAEDERARQRRAAQTP